MSVPSKFLVLQTQSPQRQLTSAAAQPISASPDLFFAQARAILHRNRQSNPTRNLDTTAATHGAPTISSAMASVSTTSWPEDLLRCIPSRRHSQIVRALLYPQMSWDQTATPPIH